jgi:hypothetical protein
MVTHMDELMKTVQTRPATQLDKNGSRVIDRARVRREGLIKIATAELLTVRGTAD